MFSFSRDDRFLYTKANEMIMETEGCYSYYLKSFGKAGKKILKLLEVENCTKQQMLTQCNVPELNTLYTLIHTSYFTSDSIQSVCR